MSIAVLYPRFDHPAVEERYASWQSQMLLRAGGDVTFVFYTPGEPASLAASGIDQEFALVVIDPLLLPPPKLAARLRDTLDAYGVAAVVPISNEAENTHQRIVMTTPYLTLRELQEIAADLQRKPPVIERVKWDRSDPGVFLCRTSLLTNSDDPPSRVLAGREVAISGNDYVHRWSSLRGQTRVDLLERIPTDATAILEFGCGEAPLGFELKKRQACRVVGIELDPEAAAIARKRIDEVHCADVREVVEKLDERFDWIIGGDIVEHIDEPWSFLTALRRVAAPGGQLLLSLPNIANGAVISDLLNGRFDYVYMGLTCVGHLRFFTRRTIEEMLTIAGWEVVEITPQEGAPTRGREDLVNKLTTAGIEFSRADVMPTGYYVIARNPPNQLPAS